MTVAVWSPAADTPIRLKVEDASDGTISVETEANTTVAEAWEVLEFDFSEEAEGTAAINFDNTYNKASIFFNFGTDGATAGEQTYYWDDMKFAGDGTGVNNSIQMNKVSMYPNPAKDHVNISLDETFDRVVIKDITGKIVKEVAANSEQLSVDVSALPKGIYIVSLMAENQVIGFK
ncbi:MAG: T9SS type A sorting domain-containing protein [Bacteroidales bacterium]|nr:T9SS type A sorting domain-containing protein [Bacteroidales bacterium]